MTVNSDLLKEARDLGVNLSRVLEAGLAAEVRRRRSESWQRENAGAIQDYNLRIEQEGVFSDGWRSF